MKRLTNTIVLSVCVVALAACGKKDESKSDDKAKPEQKAGEGAAKATGGEAKKPEKKATSLGGEPVKMDGFKIGGEGFEGQFNKALDSWTFEKWEAKKGGGNDLAARLYVDAWSADWPSDMEGFAAKLQQPDFLDMGSKWTKVEKKEAFDGGWLLTGDNSDGEDTEKAFVVQLTKQRVICRGFIKAEAKDQAASLTDAIGACKAATN